MVMGVTQMGHSCEEGGVATVRMGRRDIEDIGGSIRCGCSEAEDNGLSVCFSALGAVDDGNEGKTGGGSSMFSAAFLDNCLAKSLACHHSRNLRAKMLVGSRIFSELSRRGCTVRARFLGEKREPPSPGRAGASLDGAVARSMAL